jgi:hypothetical protein
MIDISFDDFSSFNNDQAVMNGVVTVSSSLTNSRSNSEDELDSAEYRRESSKPLTSCLVANEEASYFTNLLAYGLNSYDTFQLKSLLFRICLPNVKVIKHVYTYPGFVQSADSVSHCWSSSELLGIDSFVDYWNFIQEMIPDGSISIAHPRACDLENKLSKSVYIAFLQFKGTILSPEFDFLSCPLLSNLSQMSGWSINYSKGFKKCLAKGSLVIHVSPSGFIRLNSFFKRSN